MEILYIFAFTIFLIGTVVNYILDKKMQELVDELFKKYENLFYINKELNEVNKDLRFENDELREELRKVGTRWDIEK